MDQKYNRREFMKNSALMGAGLALSNLSLPGAGLSQANDKPLRIGIVGVGRRGSNLLKILLEIKNARIGAVCDLREDRVSRAQNWVTETGQAKPAGYFNGEYDFKNMCQRDDLDLVLTATPWKWHVPVCVAALKAEKHAATEVPAAVTLDECWQLVETAEKQKKQCVMLENYCYFRNVMLVLNMIREGLLGELLYMEGRTQENWIAENWHIFNSDGTLGWMGEALSARNGNPYPTHGLGPMAIWGNINRGDRFEYLTSMSSKSRSLNLASANEFGADHKLAKIQYAQGDANATLIHSANGVVYNLYFGGQSPQPWSPEHKVQGTNGTVTGDLFDYGNGDRWIKTRSAIKDLDQRWGYLKDHAAKYDHPLWKKSGEQANPMRTKDWSGAYDFLMLTQLVNALQTGTKPPMDVYDAATWSSISELTERSVANKCAVQDVPDFTRGQWKTRKPTNFI